MPRYHVMAGLPDSAEDLRSLAVVEAASPRLAIQRCQFHIDDGRLLIHDRLPVQLADALRAELDQLRERLREPGMYLVVTPVAAESHFIVDDAGAVREADELERPVAWPEVDDRANAE